MKIGFGNIYSWDPHLAYTKKMIADLSKSTDCAYFYCGGMFSNCYDKIITRLSGFNCIKCQAKQIAYFGFNKSLVPNLFKDNLDINIDIDIGSTVASALRMDSYDITNEYLSLLEELKISCNRLANKFRLWLRDEKIDIMIVYNGRFDLTKVLMEVAEQENVPVITHERSWFGTGINLNWKANCLSPRKFRKFQHKHQVPAQIRHLLASILVSPRFDFSLKSNEWRTFKPNTGQKLNYFSEDKENIVYFPSSPSEFLYEKELMNDFQSVEQSIRLLRARFETENLIIKAHPIWGKNIRSIPVTDLEGRLKKLCRSLNVSYISSSQNISSNDLIEKADVVITSSSSAALQAGVLGKRVVNLGVCEYSYADFVQNVFTKEELFTTDFSCNKTSSEIIEETLDFVFSMSFEKMHFSDLMYLDTSRHLQCSSRRIFYPEMLNSDYLNEDYAPTFNVPRNIDFDDASLHKKFTIRDFLQLA